MIHNTTYILWEQSFGEYRDISRLAMFVGMVWVACERVDKVGGDAVGGGGVELQWKVGWVEVRFGTSHLVPLAQ